MENIGTDNVKSLTDKGTGRETGMVTQGDPGNKGRLTRNREGRHNITKTEVEVTSKVTMEGIDKIDLSPEITDQTDPEITDQMDREKEEETDTGGLQEGTVAKGGRKITQDLGVQGISDLLEVSVAPMETEMPTVLMEVMEVIKGTEEGATGEVEEEEDDLTTVVAVSKEEEEVAEEDSDRGLKRIELRVIGRRFGKRLGQGKKGRGRRRSGKVLRGLRKRIGKEIQVS